MREQSRSIQNNETLFATARAVPKRRVQNGQFLPDRNALFQSIPKGSVGAVFGLVGGGIVKQILDMTEPQQLHVFRFHFDGKGDIPQFAAAIAERRLVFHDCPGLEAVSDRIDWAHIMSETTLHRVEALIDQALPLLRDKGLLVFNGFPSEAGVVGAVNDLAINHGCDFVAFSATSNDVMLRIVDNG